MKRTVSVIAACLLSAMLCGCTQDAAPVETTIPVTETTAQARPAATAAAIQYASALEAYEALWSGSGSFTNPQTQAQLDIHSLKSLFSPVPLAATADSFSMVDLDQDGTEEMILWVDQELAEYTLSHTPVILRYQDGALYALALTYDDFQNVKTDGSFLFWYPDQSWLGYATMHFADGSWQRDVFAEGRTGENGKMTYSVNGDATARGIYRNVELEQNGKPDVIEYSDWNAYQLGSIAQPDAPVGSADALNAYGEVFLGTKDIYHPASAEWIPLSKLSLFFTTEEFPWEVAQIAVLDLDGDGSLEAVIEVSDYMGYVILRCQEDGTVTGHGIWYRAFQELKADGSYMGSGSSFSHSYWKHHPSGDILLAECYEDENGNAVYWLDGQEVDAAAFAAFEEVQNQKPDAAWYPGWEEYLSSPQ